MGRARLFAIVLLVVLSGCALPGTPGQFDPDREPGEVAGYAHDDVFAFDGSDGLTERQLEQVTYRSMARIEVLRGLQFERDVEVEVVTRDEYRERRGESEPASAFENEVWRGAFVVDGETDVNDEFDDLYGEAVQGYYTNDRIVVISDDPDEIRIDRRVLVHELVHALQDQQFGIERTGETIDERRAELGLLEGEADYLPYLYDERCGEDWQCLADRERPPAEPRSINEGLLLSIYAPYATGPPFVDHLREAGGWEAVDDAYDRPPASTTQVIHPEYYPDVEPVDVAIEDRSNGDWEPMTDEDGAVKTETIGEATLFATLWANGAIDRAALTAGTSEYAPYNYSAEATRGWAGDTLRGYENDDEETAHVWRLAWEHEADAETFADAYRDLLAANGAEPVDDEAAIDATAHDTYRIAAGEPFAGAYRVTVADETVTIVGAPTVDDLDGVHATANASTPSIASAPADGLAPAGAAPTASTPTAPSTGTSPLAAADG